MIFEKAAIIGIGLIGSSLARAMRKHGLVSKVGVFDKNSEYMNKTMEIGIADETGELVDVVREADLVVLATPVGAYAEIVKEIGPHLKDGVIITDVGSVKKKVLADVERNLPTCVNINVVPGHPVAGTEKSGPEAGFAELFEGRWCILTPGENADEAAVKKVAKMWERAGMKVDEMSAEHHDKVMAAVSHLPHLIAFSIVGTVADLEGYEQKEIIKYSASGFRDFTRIAGSDPTMWRDIFLSNKETILELIQRFVEDLTALQRNIRWDEGDKLFELFSKTQKIRLEVIEAKQDRPEDEKLLAKNCES